MPSFTRTRGFQNRLKGGVALSFIIIPSYFIANGLPYRIVFTLGLLLGLVEFCDVVIESFFIPNRQEAGVISVIFLALILSIVSVWKYPLEIIGGVMVTVVMTDIGGYFGGKILGGIAIKSRPFPTISPNKTWEGIIVGLAFGAISAIIWVKHVIPNPPKALIVYFVLMPPFSVIGDALESYFKRHADVKDSNDFLAIHPILGWIEALLGGEGGHGGYLDRFDSVSFVMSLFFLADLFIGIIQ